MKIFDLNTIDQWKDAFESFPESCKEVYFSPEYYINWQDHEQAKPMCIFVELRNVKFLYPFFIKEIEGFNLDKPYFDISTAYGYGGVLVSEVEVAADLRLEFNELVNDWCLEHAVVAEFIRELPFVNNQLRDAKYEVVRNNVFIELDAEYKIANRHVRKNINKAKRNGLSWAWDPDMEHMDIYVKLYADSFKRIEMDEYYLFPDAYYSKLKDLFLKQAGLVNVYYNDEIINSMIVFTAYGKMVCHLIGTNYNFIELRPNDLVYHAAIEIAKDLGLTLISMGGGRVADDNLFRFKEKFGNSTKDVLVGKKINNQKIYNQLIEQWELKYPAFADRFTNFFLRYRLNPDNEKI